MTAVPAAVATFRLGLPDGWRLVTSSEVAAPASTLVATHASPTASGFTPNVTVAILETVTEDEVAGVGSEALRRLEADGHNVQIRRREALGVGRSEGLAQELRFSTRVGDREVEIAQVLLVLVVPRVDQSGGLCACATTLTVAVEDLEARAADLRALIAGLGVVPDPTA